jgi:hypothetical protein
MDNYYTRINNIKDEIKKLTEEIEFLVKKKENGKISDNEKLKITEYHNKIVDDICKKKNELVEVKNEFQKYKNEKKIKNEYETVYIYNNKKNREEIKNERDMEIIKYKEAVEYKERYDKIDCKEYPSYLFFYDKIEKFYGKMNGLFVKNDEEFDNNMDKMKKEKKEFIEKKDNGIYFKEIVTYLSNNECDNIININKEIDDIIIELITIDLYNEIENLVNEYIKSKIKTKIVKVKYNKINEYLHSIYKKNEIDIYTYYNTKYNLHILKTKDYKYKESLINRKIYEYEKNKKLHEQNEKYKKNVIINLNRDMLNYIRIKLNTSTEVVENTKKNWNKIDNDERIKYIKDYLKKQIKKDDVNMIDEIIKIYKTKKINTRHIKWNKEKGEIDEITNLKFDDNNNYELICEKKEKTNDIDENIKKNINEIILKYIILNKKINEENKSIILKIMDECIKKNIKNKRIVKMYIEENFEKIKDLVK